MSQLSGVYCTYSLTGSLIQLIEIGSIRITLCILSIGTPSGMVYIPYIEVSLIRGFDILIRTGEILLISCSLMEVSPD